MSIDVEPRPPILSAEQELALMQLELDAQADVLHNGFDHLRPSSTGPAHFTDYPEDLSVAPNQPAGPLFAPVEYPPVRPVAEDAPASSTTVEDRAFPLTDVERETAGRRTPTDPRVRALAAAAMTPSAVEEEFDRTAPAVDKALLGALAQYDPANRRHEPPSLTELGVTSGRVVSDEELATMAPGRKRNTLKDATTNIDWLATD